MFLEGLVEVYKELWRLLLLDALVEDVGEGRGGHGPHHRQHALKVGGNQPAHNFLKIRLRVKSWIR